MHWVGSAAFIGTFWFSPVGGIRASREVVGSSHRNCSSYVCVVTYSEKNSFDIYLCINLESDCFALEQHLCWLGAVDHSGTWHGTFLSSIGLGFTLGDDLISTDFHNVGRGQK